MTETAPETRAVGSLTDGLDDGVLQRFLFIRGGLVFGSVVIVTSQLVVHALPELSQERVEHLQDRGSCNSYASSEGKQLNTRQSRFWERTYGSRSFYDGGLGQDLYDSSSD